MDMLRLRPLLLLATVVLFDNAAAFHLSRTSLFHKINRSAHLAASRREVMETAGTVSSVATIFTLTTPFVTALPKQALASGGATAGGAYLLSVCVRNYSKY